jgi:SPP1 family predicted phage head-tail adaptor
MTAQPINPGKYRHQIVIRNPPADSSRDDFGGRKGSGSTVATVYAEKQDWSGSELDEAGRQTATVTTRWKTRYREDILPKMQIVLGTDVYNILSVLDFDGTQRELTIESRKVVA